MKKLALAILFTAQMVFAAVLSWDANPEPEVSGYKVYIAPDQGVNVVPGEFAFTLAADVGPQTSWTIPKWNGGIWLCVTAYTTNGLESEFSEKVRGYRPNAPRNIRIAAETIKIINNGGTVIVRTGASVTNTAKAK